MARLCQQPPLDYLPPAYAALSLPTCLSMTSQLYESLEQTEWRTCVVCWRAWYDPPQEYGFQKVQLGRRSTPVPWFNLAESKVLGNKKRRCVNQWCVRSDASAEDAQSFLVANYPEREVERITESLVCPQRMRSITFCAECKQHVQDDFTVAAPGGVLRLCDHVVDPVFFCMHAGP